MNSLIRVFGTPFAIAVYPNPTCGPQSAGRPVQQTIDRPFKDVLMKRHSTASAACNLHAVKASARNLLLCSTFLAGLPISSALAQVVVQDGQTINNLLLSGTLIVEQGGTVAGPGGFAVRNDGTTSMIVNNAGLLSGALNGIRLDDSSTLELTNSGGIEGALESGIYVFLPAGHITRLLNQSTGYIHGAQHGIAINTATSSFSNFENHGSIAGFGGSGVLVPGTALSGVTNSGPIHGYSGDGLFASTIDGLVNQSGGIIQGHGGLGLSTIGFMDNVENQSGAVIYGSTSGVWGGPINNFSNSGFVAGQTQYGIRSTTLSGLQNSSTGLIGGELNGLLMTSGSDINNAGDILGNTNYGIEASGVVTGLHNASTGRIYGGTAGILSAGLTESSNHGQIFGIGSGLSIIGAVNGLTNYGWIMGTTQSGAYIDSNAIDIMNAGEITGTGTSGTRAGIYVGGNLIRLTNTGSITNNGSATENLGIYAGGAIIGLVNSGSIVGSNSGNPAASFGVFSNTQLHSLTNSGRIFADLNGWAIMEDGSASSRLILLPGSVMQGQISLGLAAANDSLTVGRGHNLASYFADDNVFDLNDPLDSIDAEGALFATSNEAQGQLVAVADMSVPAAMDNALSDVTSAVSGIVGQRLTLPEVTPEKSWWLNGFGGGSQMSGSGASVDVNHAYGGAVAGVDGEFHDDLRLGFFLGWAGGVLDADVANGQSVDTSYYFGGVYGQRNVGNVFVNFGMTGGASSSQSKRLVANNLVLGGLETGEADYSGYFFIPEVTIGRKLDSFGMAQLRPSVRVRYAVQHSDSYSESGLSAGALTVGANTRQVVETRLQLAVPINSAGVKTSLELRGGLDNRFVLSGSSFDVTLLGQGQSFDPGSAKQAISGFVGANIQRVISPSAVLFGSAEIGVGTETSVRAAAEAGFKVTF